MLHILNDKTNYTEKIHDGHTIITGYDNDTKIIKNILYEGLERHYESVIPLLTGMKLGLVKFHDMVVAWCDLCIKQRIMGKLCTHQNANAKICNECFNICQSNIVISKERIINIIDTIGHEYSYYAISTFNENRLFILDHCQYFDEKSMTLEYTYNHYRFTYIDINNIYNLKLDTLQDYLRRLLKNKYTLLLAYNDITDINRIIAKYMIVTTYKNNKYLNNF
jgi:hypothetical protein